MREIKFRGYNKDEKYMDKMQHFNLWDTDDIPLRESIRLNGCPIMQYTGLKDKDGKEIYEGDIIKVFDKYSGVWSTNGAEVIFSIDYVGGWVISNGKENLTLGKRQNALRVIGNIRENPELLAP